MDTFWFAIIVISGIFGLIMLPIVIITTWNDIKNNNNPYGVPNEIWKKLGKEVEEKSKKKNT